MVGCMRVGCLRRDRGVGCFRHFVGDLVGTKCLCPGECSLPTLPVLTHVRGFCCRSVAGMYHCRLVLLLLEATSCRSVVPCFFPSLLHFVCQRQSVIVFFLSRAGRGGDPAGHDEVRFSDGGVLCVLRLPHLLGRGLQQQVW